MRVVVEASSFRVFEAERSTTNGVVIAEDNNDGFPTIEGAGSGKVDTLAC